MYKTLFISIVVLSFSVPTFAKDTKSDWGLVELCKKDCPKAANDEEAHKCAEKIGKLNKEFKKGKCWDQNEKYEAAQANKK